LRKHRENAFYSGLSTLMKNPGGKGRLILEVTVVSGGGIARLWVERRQVITIKK
jgi:hypothetical protein